MIVGASGCCIRRVKLVKSLELIVDDPPTWSDHVDYISTKIKMGIGVMKKTSKFLDKDSLLTLSPPPGGLLVTNWLPREQQMLRDIFSIFSADSIQNPHN